MLIYLANTNILQHGGRGAYVPLDATHVVLDMTIVPQGAFAEHPNIVEVICHESVEQEQINGAAFAECPSLKSNHATRQTFGECILSMYRPDGCRM